MANLRRLNFNFTSQCETIKNNISVHVITMLWTTRQSLPALFGCQYYTMSLEFSKDTKTVPAASGGILPRSYT